MVTDVTQLTRFDDPASLYNILNDPDVVLKLRASEYLTSQSEWQDLSGNGHHAQFGSTSGADAADPVHYPHAGVNYVSMPGTSGNYISTPSTAALNSSVLDIRRKVSFVDWTPTGDEAIASKALATGNQRAWRFLVLATTGYLYFDFSTAGTGYDENATSTVAPTVTDGDELWVRVTRSSTEVKFYTGGSGDDPVWAQLGSTQTVAATAIYSSTAALQIGAANNGALNVANCKEYRTMIYTDLTETSLVFDYNPQISFTEDQAGKATVTINRSASGEKCVEVSEPVMIVHTDDFFNVADHADLNFGANDDFTLVARIRQHGTPTSNSRFIEKRSTVGYMLLTDGTNRNARLYVEDSGGGVGDSDASDYGDGEVAIIIGERKAGETVEAFNSTTSDGSTADTTGDLTNALDLKIGGSGAYFDGEIFDILVYRRKLSATEKQLVINALTPAA